MSPEIHSKNLSTKISAETLEILDTLAQRADISRSKLIHNIIESTIDEMDMGRKIGFFQMAILIRNFSGKSSMPPAKAKNQDERVVPIRLSPEYHKKLEVLANIADRTPHYLMRNILQVGAEELNSTLIKGILPLALLVRDLKRRIVQMCENGRKAMESYEAGSSDERR